jgi:uncharacterized protein YegJ (DUF2314 family)
MKFTVQLIGLGVIFGTAILNAGNAKAQTANAVAQELQNGNAEPKYFEVPKGHHAAMHLAVKEARKTVGKFIAALEHPAPGQEDFEIKKPFIRDHQVEHIWLSEVRLVGDLFQGRIDNQPRKIAGLKIGEMASVKPNEISDWLYIDNGKLVGGFTVRVHYNELSPQQKQEFDRRADFRIEKP